MNKPKPLIGKGLPYESLKVFKEVINSYRGVPNFWNSRAVFLQARHLLNNSGFRDVHVRVNAQVWNDMEELFGDEWLQEEYKRQELGYYENAPQADTTEIA